MCVIRCMQMYANQDRHATYQWFFIGYECRVMRCQWRVMRYQGPVVRYHGCCAALVRRFTSSVITLRHIDPLLFFPSLRVMHHFTPRYVLWPSICFCGIFFFFFATSWFVLAVSYLPSYVVSYFI